METSCNIRLCYRPFRLCIWNKGVHINPLFFLDSPDLSLDKIYMMYPLALILFISLSDFLFTWIFCSLTCFCDACWITLSIPVGLHTHLLVTCARMSLLVFCCYANASFLLLMFAIHRLSRFTKPLRWSLVCGETQHAANLSPSKYSVSCHTYAYKMHCTRPRDFLIHCGFVCIHARMHMQSSTTGNI